MEFWLGVGTSDWLSETKTVDVALYDGDRLLGSRSGIGVGAVFQGAGQEVRRDWTGYALNTIDFTSLLDGTIDGRFELSPVAGAFRFDPAGLDLRSYSPDYIGPHPVMLFDAIQEPGWAAARGDFDWIRNPQVAVSPVPEPGTLTLLASGLGVGALRLRKRRQRRQEDAPAR